MTDSDFKDRAQVIASRPLDDVQRLIAHLALSLDDHIATVTGGDPAKVVDALRDLGMDRTAALLDGATRQVAAHVLRMVADESDTISRELDIRPTAEQWMRHRATQIEAGEVSDVQ